MSCDIREPYVLQAMGKACAQVIASKGYLAQTDRDFIADQIVTGKASLEFAPFGPERFGPMAS